MVEGWSITEEWCGTIVSRELDQAGRSPRFRGRAATVGKRLFVNARSWPLQVMEEMSPRSK